MNEYKKTVGAILGALIVVIIGLFFVCSQRPALQDETFSDADLDDSQFRQELMDMLDLADNSGDVQSFDATSMNESTNESVSDQDIMSMLTNDASDYYLPSVLQSPALSHQLQMVCLLINMMK